MSDTAARTHTPEPIKKLMQLQIERLKKEDDEEQWISGEELYTEGSSDEDDTATRVKRKGREERARTHRKMKENREKLDVASIRGKHMHKKDQSIKESSKKAPSSVSVQKEITSKEEEVIERKEESSDSIDDQCGRVHETVDLNCQVKDENEEECSEATGGATLSEPEISWRPKRGSIKLPSLNYEGRVEMVPNPQVQ
ncbi:uncharacterized protein LOC124167738 [Ischnura elegans]|uniref:uncharacterized protein LOC124167738 n=1 Tax=Ischnura elegans TaxID=197161 RepID=UPI001ED88EA8|nr:uncharacterized protein LOC124167738 [Ischnura elegans]